MKESSVITLNKEALQTNWNFLRSYFKGTKISAVVKGNAYGHGISVYVPLAEACGVNHFSVFNAEEARAVFDVASADTTIMIMGSLKDSDMEWCISNNIEFYVFTEERLSSALQSAKQLSKKALIHIEVETGMYRTGFELEKIPALIKTLKEHKEHLTFRGLCTHFAGAESIANYLRIKKQKRLFKKALSTFREAGLEPQIVHTCCSAAAVRLPDMHYDMLRIGIMQYGFWSGPEVLVEYLSRHKTDVSPLKRIIRWESSIMSLKHVPPGEFVGYGTSFFSHEAMTLAIIPVGYAHGFSRSLSNMGIVLVNGRRAPVTGTVNMNCIAVDVTNIPNIATGDSVILIGTQDGQEITVASFGERSSQLNYELLTRLPQDIERRIV